ncbi:MAG: hypothetical protein ACI4MT_01295 [Christensenellales bacterium]
MKKKILIVVAILVISVAALSACSITSGDKSSAKINTLDVYSFSALSGSTLLNSTVTEAEASMAQDLNADEVDAVNKYVKMLDGYLSGSGVETQLVESDKAEYAVKVRITTSGMAGDSESFMYYNETDLITGESVDGDEIENFAKTTISGIMVSGETTYILEGKKTFETETEDGETETENEIFFKTYLSETDKDLNFVTVRFVVETEADETENSYEYCSYKDGVLVEKTKIKVETETENGKTEESVKIQSFVGGVSKVYKLEREIEGDKEELKLRFSENGEEKSVKVEVVDGQYVYSFGDGSQIKCD